MAISKWQWHQYTWLTTAADVCHLDRPRGIPQSGRLSGSGEIPTLLPSAMPIRGVLPKLRGLSARRILQHKYDSIEGLPKTGDAKCGSGDSLSVELPESAS